MGTKHSKTIFKEAISAYNLFRPADNRPIEVWAHYLKDSVEEDLYGENKQIFIFEINTDDMIHRTYDAVLSQQFDNYLPISYTFTSVLDINNIRSSYPFMEIKNDYIRCIIKNIDDISPKDKYLEGTITVSLPCRFSEKTDDILKRTYSAALVFVSYKANTQLAQKTYEEWKTTIKNARSLLENNPKELTKLLPSGEPRDNTCVRIYSVGCANTVFIQHYTGLNILFDCGCENHTQYDDSKSKIQQLNPDVIIISHWHEDHHNLFASYLKNKHFQYVIYNNIRKCSNNQLVVTLASVHKKTIDLSQITYSPYIFSSGKCSDISLFVGSGTAPSNPQYGYISYSNELNDIGIILCVGTADQSHNRIILPGDVSYFCWPHNNELNLNTVSHLLLPHHGGNVYTTTPFQNVKYPKIYVSRDQSYVPINDINTAKARTYHKTFLKNSLMGGYDFSRINYTCQKLNAPHPYFSVTIMRK